MNKHAAMDVLRQHGWLARTPADFRERVLAHCDLTRLKRGQSAYDAGDDTGGIYGVVSGCVELHLSGAVGAPTLAYIGQTGQWLGDAAAIGNHKRLISVIAATNTELLRLPRASMLRIAAADPTAWLHFAELLSANAARSFATIAMLRRDDPVERIGALLLNLSGEPDRPATRVPGSQTDMAAIANLSRSTVSSAIGELARRGLVRPGYGVTEIVDHDALRAFLGLTDKAETDPSAPLRHRAVRSLSPA